MNTAHLVAWLTCLILAFLACVLGVFNAGRRIALDRDVQRLSASVDALSDQSPGAKDGHLERLRDGLARISAELRETTQDESAGISEDLRQKLVSLEERLKELQSQLE